MNHPTLMLIRHAEKPAADERAVNRQGAEDGQSLSVTGWMRAGALVSLFAPADGRDHRPLLPQPRHLVAARPTTQRPSTRPRDTLLPLAEALGLSIDEQWSAEDPHPAVAAALRRLEGPVLVCWRHEDLPALAVELLLGRSAPSRWPPSRYDLVWVIQQIGPSWRLTQVAQFLLPGDSARPVPFARRMAVGSGTAPR
jgi:hypothetical protein